MKKRMLVLATTFIILLGCSMKVCAEPKLMENGWIFDAEFYAQQNPDVVSILGAEEDILFQHYVDYGKTEGRLAYLPGSESVLSEVERVSAGTLDKEYYNKYTKDGYVYLEKLLWCTPASVIQEVPSVWSGTADEFIEALYAGTLDSEYSYITYPGDNYATRYNKYYNYTITGKVIDDYKYSASEKYGHLATINLWLENSYGLDFRLVIEPDTPYTVGETITIKGYTGFVSGKSSPQLICGARYTYSE